MKKLKWSKDKAGNIFDIRDGNNTFVIRRSDNYRMLDFKHYERRGSIRLKYISSAKKVAELICNG